MRFLSIVLSLVCLGFLGYTYIGHTQYIDGLKQAHKKIIDLDGFAYTQPELVEEKISAPPVSAATTEPEEKNLVPASQPVLPIQKQHQNAQSDQKALEATSDNQSTHLSKESVNASEQASIESEGVKQEQASQTSSENAAQQSSESEQGVSSAAEPELACYYIGPFKESVLKDIREDIYRLKFENRVFVETIEQLSDYYVLSGNYETEALANKRLEYFANNGLKGLRVIKTDQDRYTILLKVFNEEVEARKWAQKAGVIFGIRDFLIKKPENHNVPLVRLTFNKLNAEDVKHVEELATKMNEVAHPCNVD